MERATYHCLMCPQVIPVLAPCGKKGISYYRALVNSEAKGWDFLHQTIYSHNVHSIEQFEPLSSAPLYCSLVKAVAKSHNCTAANPHSLFSLLFLMSGCYLVHS